MSGDELDLDAETEAAIERTAAGLVEAGFFPDTAMAAAALVESLQAYAPPVEARTATSPAPHRVDVPALVAEVRRLRAKVQRVEALAGEIERGEWGDHWRDINVHGAIRSRLATRDDV